MNQVDIFQDQYFLSPSPIYGTSRFSDKNIAENSNNYVISWLSFDALKEHMVLCTVNRCHTEKFKQSFEGYNPNFGHHNKTKECTYSKTISNGCVELVQVFRILDEQNIEVTLECSVRIIYHTELTTITLPVDAILRADRSVKEKLANSGVYFIDNGFKIWCEKFTDELNKAEIHTEYLDFFQDEDRIWHHSQAETIALNAVDSLYVLNRLGIDVTEMTNDSLLRLTLFLYGICGQILSVIHGMTVFNIAKIALIYPEQSAALNDLKEIFSGNTGTPLYPGRSFDNDLIILRNKIALVAMLGTDYYKSQCLDVITKHGADLKALPLFVDINSRSFENCHDILCINYNITNIGKIDDIFYWAIRTLLNDHSLAADIEKCFKRYHIMIENDTETLSTRNLISILLALAETYLTRLGVSAKDLIGVLQRYHEYLTAGSDSYSIIYRLKEYLVRLRDIPIKHFHNYTGKTSSTIFIKGNMLLINSDTLGYIAQMCGTVRTTLVHILNNEDVLCTNHGSNLRNFRIGERTERMYALDCSKLFDIGELRPMCPDENLPASMYKIPIGTADNYEIFFDIYPTDCTKNNPFALITGATGSGKSTLCKTLAINAAKLGLSVVILGTDTSLLDLECDTYEPEDTAEISINSFFETLRTELTDLEASLSDTAFTLMLDQYYESYDEILNCFCELIVGEEGMDSLLIKAQKTVDQLTGFSWKKTVVNGKISQVIAQTPKGTEQLLLDFFNYKAEQSEVQHTLLLLDEVQDFSWDSKSTLVSKILRKGRKYGIVGVFSTQFLNADNGTNIAAALRQIETYFVFKPSNEISALKYLGYTSKDTEARDVLELLDTGEVLAKGHLSTDICSLNYPVRFNVNCEF